MVFNSQVLIKVKLHTTDYKVFNIYRVVSLLILVCSLLSSVILFTVDYLDFTFYKLALIKNIIGLTYRELGYKLLYYRLGVVI